MSEKKSDAQKRREAAALVPGRVKAKEQLARRKLAARRARKVEKLLRQKAGVS